jgi:hypothetical protein
VGAIRTSAEGRFADEDFPRARHPAVMVLVDEMGANTPVAPLHARVPCGRRVH